MQLGHSGIVVYIFLIFLKMNFLEWGHFGNTLHICCSQIKNPGTYLRSIHLAFPLLRVSEENLLFFFIWLDDIWHSSFCGQKAGKNLFFSLFVWPILGILRLGLGGMCSQKHKYYALTEIFDRHKL